MNILLTLILVFMVAICITGMLMYRRLRRTVTEFVTPISDDQPSPLAMTIDSVASMIARANVAQAKATFMGMGSGAARAEKGLQGDIALDVAAQEGGLVGLLANFPTVRKSIKRNPALLDVAMNILANSGANRGNTASAKPRFNL